MIELKNLSFEYKNGNKLFTNINLNLGQGHICGLLGKNGAGKTTLLKLMAGLVFPGQGESQVLGQTPGERHPSFLQDIYFLPEDLYTPALTPAEYVKFYAPFYPKFDTALLQNYLQEFDIPVQQLLSQFSYGQQKKFFIAFGLASGCRLLILDEPTNGLDIPSKTQFRKLVASTIDDEKLFIISTHQVHDVENLIDTVVIVEQGEIVFQHSLLEVADRLAFVQRQTQPDPGMCFYYEKNLGGYVEVVSNSSGQETHIDLEILFNAVLASKSQIQTAFLSR